MVAPPFNINQAVPGDSDIVSQFPAIERSYRDTAESWLLVNHDTNGNHARVDMPRIASPTAPAASVDVLYISTTGRLKIKHSDGTEEYVGVPPGNTGFTSSPSVPVGWLLADGTAVSRATYPDLFATIGTFYGAGDTVTTFNVPDLRGRVQIGEDLASGRITTASLSGTTLGNFGGHETYTLLAANVPGGVTVTVNSLSVIGVSLTVSGTITGSSTGQTAAGTVSGTASGGTVTGTPTGTISGTAAVTSTTPRTATGTIQSANVVGGADKVFTANGVNEAIASSGSITASFSGTGLSGASLTSPATVSGSFAGAAVSTGAVSGTFSGSGSGGTGSGTGAGTTTGSATAFSNMVPALVLKPIIKT